VTSPYPQQLEITISLKRKRWLAVFTTAFTALCATMFVLDWRMERADYPIWLLQLLVLVVTSYRVATFGYEVVIQDDTVRIRSLLRSWQFPLLAADGVTPSKGKRHRVWGVHYIDGGQRRNIVVMTGQDLRTTPLAEAGAP
jgi:hypothetical protein